MMFLIGFIIASFLTIIAVLSALYIQHIIEEKKVSANIEILSSVLFVCIFVLSPVIFGHAVFEMLKNINL